MDQDATWYKEVGVGPSHIVLEGDQMPVAPLPAPQISEIPVVAKRRDGSRCYLVRW